MAYIAKTTLMNAPQILVQTMVHVTMASTISPALAHQVSQEIPVV